MSVWLDRLETVAEDECNSREYLIDGEYDTESPCFLHHLCESSGGLRLGLGVGL